MVEQGHDQQCASITDPTTASVSANERELHDAKRQHGENPVFTGQHQDEQCTVTAKPPSLVCMTAAVAVRSAA